MHISLDSALGRQRRLNSVGESVLQIAPSAAAAYSLRSLTGGDPKVVRVRRGSDNHEQDFTASEVSSGALTSFVNAQVVAPLDIQALTATGRDGDFLIAKAAYSLRSLGTRQATLAATGDTVARADGKYVCQVRRSSDDALKSFTATEITDGTLLAFTNESNVTYTSDFSSGEDSWGAFDDVSADGRFDGIGGLDDNLRLTIGTATSQHRGYRSNVLPANQKINFSARVFIPSTNSVVDSIGIRDASGSVIIAAGTTPTQDQWVTVTANNVTVSNHQLRVDIQDGGTNNFAGNGVDAIYLREITVTQVTSDGFVKTWYDQSVTTQAGDTATGNHAVQATAASQPKIVSSGSLVTGGLRFDDAQKLETAGTFSFGDGTTLSTFITNKSDGDENAYLFRFVSDYIVYNTSGGVRRVFAGTNANSGSLGSDEELWTTISTLNSSGGTANFFADGTLVSSADANIGTKTVSSRVLNIGGSASTTHWNGTVNEVIFYDTDQTDNRTAIEANIGEAYSIDLPSGVDPGFDQVDGFVETWYDQSGNGRDSINTTAAQQPIIVEAGVFQDGLKFTHTDTTNGKRLFVPLTAANLGIFTFVYVGKVTESDTSYNNLLGATRGVTNFAPGTAGISIKSSDGTVVFINEETSTSRVISASSTSATLNEDFVAFATYEDAEAGPELTLQVDAGNQIFSFGSAYTLTSTKDIGIMNATGSAGGYRTQESPTGICREVLVYDTHQGDNRVALVDNINNQYSLF